MHKLMFSHLLVLPLLARGRRQRRRFVAPPAAPSVPTLVNLRDEYFVPKGWSSKRLINYHYDWGAGQWVRHDGYTEIFNRGNPEVFGQTTLVRWDFTKSGVDNYWSPGKDYSLAFYFREEGGIIYAPAHYPVQGIPSLDNPPSNMGICGGPGPCSLTHVMYVNQEIGGWENPPRPYVYMPVVWDLSSPYNFQRTMRFRHVMSAAEARAGSGGGYEVDWKVTGCYLGNYRFGDTYDCGGRVTGSRPSERSGEMIVVSQDETGPTWRGIERWYFQKGVGLVAIEGYIPATAYWYFLSL